MDSMEEKVNLETPVLQDPSYHPQLKKDHLVRPDFLGCPDCVERTVMLGSLDGLVQGDQLETLVSEGCLGHLGWS